ncbi:MAG: AMP-binding protein [Alphaproteobacteria bacterium]|nr:AMP-binding protein [Alphaproteobacteria bacterium]
MATLDKTRLTPAMAERFRKSGAWSEETFAGILARHAKATPDREALSDGGHRLTWRKLAEAIDRMALRLARTGVRAGETVLIQLPNWAEFALCFFALERLGAIAVTAPTAFRMRTIEHMLRASGATTYITCARFRDFDHLGMAGALHEEVTSLQRVVILRAGADPKLPPGLACLDDVLRGEGAVEGFTPARVVADAVMRLAFTTNTAGEPRAAMHSHNTTLAACHMLNADLGLGAEDVSLVWQPCGLPWGYLTLVQSLIAGGRAVLIDDFRARHALQMIERERATYLTGTAEQFASILREPDLYAHDLMSVRRAVAAGPAASVETLRAWHKGVRGAFLSLYGSPDAGFHTYTRPGDAEETLVGSVGRPGSQMGLRILAGDGGALPAGQEGEVACEGPSLHLGYLDDDKADKAAFTADGWLRTGELGDVDAAGNLRLAGRTVGNVRPASRPMFARTLA